MSARVTAVLGEIIQGMLWISVQQGGQFRMLLSGLA